MEKKVYCIAVDDLQEYGEENNLSCDINIISNEDYTKACNKYGWCLTLEEFVQNFNEDSDLAPTNSYHYIRII